MRDESTNPRGRISRRWWVATLLCLLFILHPSSLILSQEIPLVGRPTEHFYGAAGRGVKVAWQLDRTEVPEDGEIVATLVVSNVANPRNVTRPDLKELKDFHDRFVITDSPDPPPANATEVRFSYRLRPRNPQVKEVPTLSFYYFNVAAAEGRQQFKLTHTGQPIPITVTAAKSKVAAVPVPMTEPEHLFAITTGPGVLGEGLSLGGGWVWLVAGLTGPLLALAWYAAWRRVYPDAARLAKIRRSRAARRATDAVRRAGRTDDPPAAVAAAVLGYLRARFPLPPGAVTPSELGNALAELGVPASECGAVAGFFRECDAARFAPPADTGVSLAADAGALVARLEAA
jgi:hypothetical protein